VPDGFPLTALQARARDVWKSGRPFVSLEIATELAGTLPPAYYLDFETINPAVPLYPGTRPYELIPLQWSLHRVGPDGAVGHVDFLADGLSDPRRAFAEYLLAALTEDAPIVVYSAFEQRILEALMKCLPDRAAPLAQVVSRLVDLLPVIRRTLYHADFAGSFSLKSVAPALVTAFGYKDLGGIADGGEASAALFALALGRVKDPDEADRLQQALLAYCARDTEALVRLHARLRELAREPGSR